MSRVLGRDGVVRVDDRADRHERQRRLGVVAQLREAALEHDVVRLAAPSTAAASRRMSARARPAAPFTAPRPVTANWLAYVPEKPACEFQ